MASVAVAHHRNHHHNRKGINCRSSHFFHPNPSKKSSIPNQIPKDSTFNDLWAGPAYSNSPPPSSLPIPKFSLRQNRSVFLELPVVDSRVLIHPGAKSAPVSPNSESISSSTDFFVTAASATENLRKILNLDVGN